MTDEAREVATSEVSTGVPLSQRATWFLLLLPLSWFLWTGARGIDYGEHWDEAFQVRLVQRSIAEETLLPGWYNYPSVSYWLALSALSPEVLATDYSEIGTRGPLGVGEQVKGLAPIQEELTAVTRDPGFLLRMRTVFLWTSALVILGVFCAARRRSGPWESLFAAGLVATSWELAYHARWVAPDAILAALVALFLAALLRAHEGKTSLVWLGVLAGLAMGTKYTAGLLLLPLLLLWWRTAPERQPRRLLGALAACVGSFLVVTPGALLQPVRFWRDVAFEHFHYSEAGHYGFGVDAGLEHLTLMLRWIGTDLGSPYAPWALLVTFLALIGAVSSWRRDRLEAALVLLVPVAWVLFFATQKVLFVRNLLPLAPFLALLAARGVSFLSQSLPDRARALPAALSVCILVVNGAWLHEASESILARKTSSQDLPAELLGWLESELGDRTVFLSEPLARELHTKLGGSLPEGCVVSTDTSTDLAAFRPAEVALNAFPGDPAGTLQSNLPGCLVASFGPQEVNWEWYTTWREPRIVVIKRSFLEPLQKKQPSDH